MIYLIDDNAGNQREIYGAGFIDEGVFADYITHIERLGKDFDPSLVLKDTDVILMHDTLQDFIDGKFVEGSQSAKTKIEDFVKAKNIPLVNFSDGHDGPGEFDTDGNINNLKKSLFYSRLYDFLEDLRSSGIPQIKILAYGKNYRKILLEREIKNLYVKLSGKTTDETLSLGDIIPTSRDESVKEPNYLKHIVEMSQPALGMTYENILDYIEDEEITVGDFKHKLDSIFKSVSKYGKNTYTWK